jgi:hypothetical protein
MKHLIKILSLIGLFVIPQIAFPDSIPSTYTSLTDDALKASARSEMGIEIGMFTFLGTDFQLYYRSNESPWLIGFKSAKWTESSYLFGNKSSETTYTVAGPFIRYLFSTEADKTWYLGASMLKESMEVNCLTIGLVDSDKDSSTSPYIGGGKMGRRGKSLYYNIGFLLSPWASLSTQTAGCMDKLDGLVDVNFAIGFVF